MSKLNFIVDGMLSGTGIRDADNGGYIDPSKIGVSTPLCVEISDWQARYENAHFFQFEDATENELLDNQGIEISKKLREEFPNSTVSYFSSARLLEIPF